MRALYDRIASMIEGHWIHKRKGFVLGDAGWDRMAAGIEEEVGELSRALASVRLSQAGSPFSEATEREHAMEEAADTLVILLHIVYRLSDNGLETVVARAHEKLTERFRCAE